MNILKEVLKHEVFPALGCTEPIAVAYAASLAGQQVEGEIEEIGIIVDPGVFKNGFAVTVPNTGGEKGNLIAGVLGALIKRPKLKMEILKGAGTETLTQAKVLIAEKKAKINFDPSRTDLYIDVTIKTVRALPGPSWQAPIRIWCFWRRTINRFIPRSRLKTALPVKPINRR